MTERDGRTVLLLTALGVSILFLGTMLYSTGGRVVPQVVDLYVVCQYAKAFAEGHPFRYNPGELPSTGSTSLLYTALLGVAHAAGARGEGLVTVAILAGVLFFGTVALARDLGARLGGPEVGLLGGALVALNGPLAWSFLYGSDVGLFLFLSTWLLDRWLVFWRDGPARGFALAGALVALARPEGLFLTSLLALVSWRRIRQAPLRERWLPLAPVAAGLGVLLLYRVVTGSWLGSSFSEKSLLANYGLRDGAGLVAEYLTDVAHGLLLGFYPSPAALGFSRGYAPYYFPPLALVFIVWAAVRVPAGLRQPVALWLGAMVAVFLLVSGNVFVGVHFNRHIVWAFPGLLVLTAAGLALATQEREGARPLFLAGAGLALGLGLLSIVRFAALYGEMAGSIARRELPLAEWIRKELPPGVAMANVATSVEYLTGHRNLNLHGVTTPAFTGGRTAEREANMFEALGRLPEAQRPAYLITSVSTQESSPLLRALVLDPPLFQTTSLSDELMVCRMRYDLVGRNRRLYTAAALEAVRGLQEVDSLNVCDPVDEERHRYHFVSSLGDVRLHGAVHLDRYPTADGGEELADGGRAIVGGERFRVRTRADRPLVVVMRSTPRLEVGTRQSATSGIHGLEMREAGFVVRVGGEVLMRLSIRPPTPGWVETAFRIPAPAVREGGTDLDLQGRYASFQYWFYQ